MRKQVMIVFSLMSLLHTLSACHTHTSCEDFAKRMGRRQVNIMVADSGPIGTSIELQGTDPATGKIIEFRDRTAFYIYVKDRLSVGDTLVKIRGEQFFTIKKPTCNIIIDFSCRSDPYQPMGIDTVPKTSSRLVIIRNDSLDWLKNN
ncbi:hypothetical protein [Hymenobacter metallilatus]|uniref:DUF4369 domain-containing protein n=1 Tax=Hymenobacter metallilatus TaxID=2493666 RepID=A0A3R9UHR8_9BACT|nr:hypothetical protein [Hymenobacter metallilatus]RSK31784.1 hypothetical protein EI290_13235 [Hymenobacter metallilatus]